MLFSHCDYFKAALFIRRVVYHFDFFLFEKKKKKVKKVKACLGKKKKVFSHATIKIDFALVKEGLLPSLHAAFNCG